CWAGARGSRARGREEAWRVHGVGAWGPTIRVTLPVVAPAITSSALLVFLNAAGQFGIPAVIGIPMHYEVITTRIWIGLGYFPPKYTEAAAFAVVLLAFSSIIVFLQHRMLANKSYATVTGKGFKPAVAALCRPRHVHRLLRGEHRFALRSAGLHVLPTLPVVRVRAELMDIG